VNVGGSTSTLKTHESPTYIFMVAQQLAAQVEGWEGWVNLHVPRVLEAHWLCVVTTQNPEA
jgi:hypothetical protein